MRKNKGFSLIELMIVVAIIGILSMLAMPFYKEYVMRVKITQAVAEAVPVKAMIFDIYSNDPYIEEGSSTVNYIVSEMSKFKSDVLFGVEYSRYGNNASNSQNYQHGYIIRLNKKKIGIPDDPGPYNFDMFTQLYVSVARKFDTPIIVRYPDGSTRTIPANTESTEVFCGNLAASGVIAAFYLQTKYLPKGCNDTMIIPSNGNKIIEVIKGGLK